MSGQISGMLAAPAAPSDRITFQESPARKITKKPDAKMSRPVPRSGCRAISPTGSASAAMSGPSMRRERMSNARLIMLVVLRLVVARLGKLGGVLLPEEEVVEYLARDGSRCRSAVLPVLDQDGQRQLRRVGGGEGD